MMSVAQPPKRRFFTVAAYIERPTGKPYMLIDL